MTIPPSRADTRAPHRASALDDYVTYRRLLYRGYVLRARITLLQCVLWVVSPIATPLIIWTIRRWFEPVKAEARALSRAVHSLRDRLAMERKARVATVFQNPWT